MTDLAAIGPADLRAVTERIEADVDLASVAGRHGYLFASGGHGFAGHRVAARIPLPAPWPSSVDDAVAQLALIHSESDHDRPGTGVVAFAALPFERTAAAELVVPELVVGRDADGTRWLTRVTGPGRPLPELDLGGYETRDRLPEPTSVTITNSVSPEYWRAMVAEATRRIGDGELDKVVLARELSITADQPIDPALVIARLAKTFPTSFVYSVDGFVGASPELLVSRSGDMVRAQPMAGTIRRTGDPTRDTQLAAALLASAKDRSEHQITIDAVADALLPWCSYLDAGAEPEVFSVANVQHLASRVEGRLSSPAPSVLQIVGDLHPTPAVGGQPTDAALRMMRDLEGRDRDRYAGPVGWVDATGNGAFAVGLRGAQIDGSTARVMAGVGVVADSDPDAELAETRSKFSAILGALVDP